MKEAITCPVCKSSAHRIMNAERSVWEVECEKCMEYWVACNFWEDLLKAMFDVDNLSRGLRLWLKEKEKPAVLGSGNDVMNLQRGPGKE